MTISRVAAVLTFVLLCALPAAALACDLCAVYRGQEAREHKRGVSLGIFEQYTHFGTLQLDGDEVANSVDQRLDSSITQVFAGYQFNQLAGAQITFPYIHRSYRRAEGAGIEDGYVDGLGDVSIIGNFRLYELLTRETIFIWSATGGIKLPTGDSARLKEELVEVAPPPGAPESGIHGHDLALGSGSYDGIIGTSVFFSYDRFFAAMDAQYAIRTRGDFGYRYANDLIWSVRPGVFPLLEDEYTIGVQLAVSGETKGRDKFMGEKAEDTGITTLFMGPEISFTWKEHISASIGADLPVVRENTALQIVPDYKIRAGLVWRP